MSRFVGILLMLATGCVLAEVIDSSSREPWNLLVALGIAMLILGLLLGVLATARQGLWAVVGSIAIVGSLYASGRVRYPLVEGEEFRTLVLAATPPTALVLGALIGSRFLRRRQQALVEPAHHD